MKELGIVLLTFFWGLTPQIAFAKGGDFIGNGGGIAEKNFLFALENIEVYSRICLESKSCKMDYAQQNLLDLLIRNMPEEKRNPRLLQFLSESKQPGFFKINEEMKVAKTGSSVGSPIYINVDLIYNKNVFGVYEAVSIPQALAILVHEFAHHFTSTPCEQLDFLGVKLASFVENQIQKSQALPWDPSVSVTVISVMQANLFPQVLLNVGQTVVNISNLVQAAVYCPTTTIPLPVLPFPDIVLEKGRPLGAIYHNVHWQGFGEDGRPYKLVGNLTKFCQQESIFVVAPAFEINISFKTMKDSNSALVVDESSIQVRQIYKPWYKIMQF